MMLSTPTIESARRD